MAISVDPDAKQSKKFSSTGAYEKKLKKRKQDEEDARVLAEETKITESVKSGEKKEGEDKRSNFQKAKDAGKAVGKSVASSYNRIGEGVAEVIANDSKDQKGARDAESSASASNTQLIADLGKQLKDPNLDPEKRKRIEKTVNTLTELNQDTFKTSNERSKQVQERTDPVKGAAAVGSIGFDIATAGTIGSATKAAAKQTAGFTAKQAAKKVATGAGQGAASGALGAIEEKGKDTKIGDVAKGGVAGAVVGGVLTGAGEIVGTGIRSFMKRGPKEALNELSEKAAAKVDEQKLLPAGERNITNSSKTTVAGEPEATKTIPVTDDEYTKEFNRLSKSYDQSIKAAEAEKSPIKQRALADQAHDDHLRQLEALNDQYINGKPNVDASEVVPAKEVETGFQILSEADQAAAKGLRGEKRVAYMRKAQIDKIVEDAQQTGTARTPDELRALMRERTALDDFVNGKGPNPSETVYKPGEKYEPGSGVDADGVVKTSPMTAATAVSDEAGAIRKEGVRAKLANIFAPVNNLSEKTQATFKKNAGGRYVADVRGKAVVKELKEAADSEGVKLDFDLARQIEDGTAPDTEFTKTFREIADKTRNEANDAGLDIGYRENYVPHIWDKSPDEVDSIARRAGLKARAEGERVIPTYEEGLKLGLKPKYDNPADMMGDYVRNLETTRTNVALLTDLRDQGLVQSGKPPAGWKAISAEGFPKTVQGNTLYAPKEVARVLNNLYGNPDRVIDKMLSKTAGFNSKWQDIALAGGIPGTPANFFTFSQMMKEGALGLGQLVTGSPIKGAKTVYSPVAAFTRSFSQKQTDKFIKANSGFIEAMAKRGAPIKFADDGGKWAKLFNEPTFGRFMPNLQLNTAKNVQNALEKKMGREAALDATADIVRKMYGITDELMTGREKAVQDLIGSVGFAPKYRESIMNVLGHTARSVVDPRTWGDRSYSLNRRLAVGMGATYMIYDQINRATMGHGIDKNPEGKELALGIPYGEDENGNQKVVYIPFMPSFLTLPRAAVGAVSAAAKGDLEGVVGEGGKFLSMPIQTGSQIINNKDYFGRPIVNDAKTAEEEKVAEDSVATQWGKRAMYIAGQSTPAAVRAGLSALQGKPMEQNIAQAAEAPVRFGKISDKSGPEGSYSPGEVTNDWFKIYNKTDVKRRKASEEVTNLVKQGKVNEAKRKADEFNEQLSGKFSPYYDKYGSNPSEDPMWDEMINGLFIKTSERAFTARAKQ